MTQFIHAGKVAAVEEERERPYWLSLNRSKEIKLRCAPMVNDVEKITRLLRAHNQKLQLQTPSWDQMMRVLAESPKNKEDVINQWIAELADKNPREGAELCADDVLYTAGPVGDLPMHQAFLLGEPELGKRLVEKFHCRPGIDGEFRQGSGESTIFYPNSNAGINTPYVSDLDVWKTLVPNTFDDGGIYTGETVLHIAIVQMDLDLVKWMLDRHICITSRARGAFFKPPSCITEQQLQAVNMSAIARGLGATTNFFKNEDSVCDYGEFPFSFAASIGNIAIMKVLAKHAERGGILKQELIEVLKTQRKIRASLGINDEIVVTEKGGFMRLLIGLQDSRGNTALHMAVHYDQQESFDWIMSHHGLSPSHVFAFPSHVLPSARRPPEKESLPRMSFPQQDNRQKRREHFLLSRSLTVALLSWAFTVP